MPEFNRRRFLLTVTAAGAATAAISSAWFFPKPNDGVRTSRFLRFGQYHRDLRFQLSKFYSAKSLAEKRVLQLNLETHKWETIDVSSAPHVVETHPTESRYSLAATQKADTISVVDWEQRAQTFEHLLADGHFFYGHGVFAEDGSSIFASTYHATKPASIMQFSFPELRLVRKFDLPYGLSHELLTLDSNYLLLGISGLNQKKGPGFGVLELKTSKFFLFPIEDVKRPQISAITHLEKLSSGFVGTYNEIEGDVRRPTGLASLIGDRVGFDLTPEVSKLDFEILSLAFDTNKQQIWATVPMADKIIICEESSQKILEEITAEQLRMLAGSRVTAESDLRPLGLAHDSARGLTYVVTAEVVLVLETANRNVSKIILKPHVGYSAHARLA